MGEPHDAAAAYQRPHAILVVDDDQAMCRYCTAAMRHIGHTVVATTSSLAALDHLRQQPFDLILTDIKMPQLSGLELTRHARALDPSIAIVIMSGQTSLEMLREVVQNGITSYLSKPFEVEELRLTVTQVLHQQAVMRDKMRLEALVHQLKLSNSFNETLELPELCGAIMRVLSQEVGSTCLYVLLNEEQPRLLFGCQQQPPLEPPAWELLQRAASRSHAIRSKLALMGQERQVMSMPLQFGGRQIGSVLFDHSAVLSPARSESVALLVNHAAAALHNAQLYTEVQEANSRLQELDRLKSEFLAITSHELRTPLAIVLGYAMLLHDQAEPPARDYLRRMLESGQRINDIIEDMTHLRQVEQRQTQLHLEDIRIDELLSECAERVQPLALAKQQTIAIDTGDFGPETISIDRDKIALGITNLLSNAIKFTPPTGTIAVRAWCEQISSVPYRHSDGVALLAPGAWVLISIIDSGIGIPPALQRRIFERFYQVADSLTRENGGTGLGLALVKGMVTLHNGHVWVTSREGSGSTFTVALPQRGPQSLIS